MFLEAQTFGFERVDYVWYRNPAASVPDLFHVQAAGMHLTCVCLKLGPQKPREKGK